MVCTTNTYSLVWIDPTILLMNLKGVLRVSWQTLRESSTLLQKYVAKQNCTDWTVYSVGVGVPKSGHTRIRVRSSLLLTSVGVLPFVSMEVGSGYQCVKMVQQKALLKCKCSCSLNLNFTSPHSVLFVESVILGFYSETCVKQSVLSKKYPVVQEKRTIYFVITILSKSSESGLKSNQTLLYHPAWTKLKLSMLLSTAHPLNTWCKLTWLM